jgi:hypothetical protein
MTLGMTSDRGSGCDQFGRLLKARRRPRHCLGSVASRQNSRAVAQHDQAARVFVDEKLIEPSGCGQVIVAAQDAIKALAFAALTEEFDGVFADRHVVVDAIVRYGPAVMAVADAVLNAIVDNGMGLGPGDGSGQWGASMLSACGPSHWYDHQSIWQCSLFANVAATATKAMAAPGP